MTEASLVWAEGGKTHSVIPLEQFELDGRRYVRGALAAAPSFPMVFRLETNGLVRLSHDEAAAIASAQATAILLRAALTAVDGKRHLPLVLVELDGREYVVLWDVEGGTTRVGEVRDDAVDPVGDPVTARAVEALFFLSVIPAGVVRESFERQRATDVLEKARAELLRLSSSLVALGKAGQTDEDYERVRRSYEEISEAVLKIEQALSAENREPEPGNDLGSA